MDVQERRSGFDLSFAQDYPALVCRRCDDRATGAQGRPSEMQLNYDDGENPVFIDGLKCWRRYRLGGFVTMRDFHGGQTLEEFHLRINLAGTGSRNDQP